MTDPCALCGLNARWGEVRLTMVRWLIPVHPDRPYDMVPRCTDRAACRERCAERGLPWLVADRAEEVARG